MKKVVAVLLCLGLIVICAAAFGIAALKNTDIPKLYFRGDMSGMQEKTDVRSISVQYDDGTGGQKLSAFAEIKPQGSSSLRYDKKNYTITFYADEEHEEKMGVDVGWGAQSKYCLKANWVDRTHAKNVVTARLASQVQQKYGLLTRAPCNGLIDGFPVEIYINGNFHGLYTFNIPKDAWQFAMDKDNPNHIVVCGEVLSPASQFRADPDWIGWGIEVGEDADAIQEKMNVLFDFVRNSSDEVFKQEFEQHLDLDAALNYYILCDLAYMHDNLGRNMLMATYDGAKWYLSLYDLDSTWGIGWDGEYMSEFMSEELDFAQSLLFERIQTCFAQELKARYWELREDLLSREHIMEEFEGFRAQIPELTFVKEAMVWGTGILRKTEDLPGADYDDLEQYLNVRLPLLDAKYR